MVQFASRMDLLKGSEIQELLKLTAQPDIISFAGGMPAPELFPVEQMMEASRAVLEENGRVALQYSSTEGYPKLRQQIADRMLAKNNIHTDVKKRRGKKRAENGPAAQIWREVQKIREESRHFPQRKLM